MDLNFEDLARSLKYSTEFDEIPVGIKEFVTSEDYLNLGGLSPEQYKLVEAGTQIYRKETLISLYGEEEGLKRYKRTFNEVIMYLGKSSGKDHVSTIICAYVVYLLLCLKDPAKYYGQDKGDSIDIINIAINAQQAKRVFFKGFCNKIDNSPWFAGKYDKKNDVVEFDKSITVYSGHSEKESWEGFNLILAVLDEISGFAVDNASGNPNAKTGEEIYKMFSASVTSRYPELGKTLLLSFSRYKGDFIDKRYHEVIKEKEIEYKKHTFKLDPEMPDGVSNNEFDIEWEEDHIVSYTEPKVFALRRPTWVMNPLRTVDDFMSKFYKDPKDSYGRFACMPSDSVDSYFGSAEKIKEAFRLNRLMVDEDGVFAESFKPKPDVKYYVHADLAQVHDRAAVSMAHVAGWQELKIMGSETLISPKIVVDFVRYWTPTRDRTIDLSEVKDFIFSLKHRGFDVELVTFDRWGSVDIMQELNANGIKSDNLSIQKKHYDDFKLAVYENRIVGPNIPILIDELLKLRITKANRVDHPRSGHDDMAQAVCGAIFNATAHSSRHLNGSIEVVTLSDINRTLQEERRSKYEDDKRNGKDRAGSKTVPPRIPQDIDEYLKSMKVL